MPMGVFNILYQAVTHDNSPTPLEASNSGDLLHSFSLGSCLTRGLPVARRCVSPCPSPPWLQK